MGPYELKKATVSIVVSFSGKRKAVPEKRVLPATVAPTVRTFLAIPGLIIVHVEREMFPSFPAPNSSKFSGFCVKEAHNNAGYYALFRSSLECPRHCMDAQ